MIIRSTKNNMINISKLRIITSNANKRIIEANERIALLNRLLTKLRFKQIILRIITLFMYNYRKETIKLGMDEILDEKKEIKNSELNFEFLPNQTSFIIDKMIVLLNQFRKLKVFLKLDGTFYSYDELDINDFNKEYFNLYYRKNKKIYLEDDMHIYEFNSLFVSMYDKKNNLKELFSYDNIQISIKDILFKSKNKKNDLVINDMKWLYQKKDGSKDESFEDNYQLYYYKLRVLKINFKGNNGNQEFAILGNNFEKIDLFHNLLQDYISSLKDVFYEVITDKSLNVLNQKKMHEYFLESNEYSDIIYKILNDDKDEFISPNKIRKQYKLTNNDVINIVNILKKFQYVNVNLSLDLERKYKISDTKLMYDALLLHRKQILLQGDKDGQTN